ncbi:MAG: serine/threonine protein kinase, partial [Myxococcales bacterium]|nr:serine/threonine protein kinase [Myxococcales bacterium]
MLGEGGMGIVYAAFDDELARPVAIKLVRSAALGDRARARMRREAQAMAQISHANVVQIYDVGEHSGELFLAMELVHGEDLDSWLAELGPARVRGARRREIIDVFVAAGMGLAAAHAAGLVHRDFKPGNVLVGAGVVKVGDFGLARGEGIGLEPEEHAANSMVPELASRMTETGAVVGTPAYLAPEQILGQPASAASDQFAFCVALYEALVGERPFAGETMRELAANLLASRRRALPEGISLPPWLLAVLDRGLAREPGKRWPGMEDLLTALLDDPARRRRRRLAVGACAFALAACAGGLGLDALMQRRACQAQGQVLAAVWDEDAKARLGESFT